MAAISAAVMGASCKPSISKTVSGGVVDVAGKSDNEIVFRHSIVYSYDDSVRVHL